MPTGEEAERYEREQETRWIHIEAMREQERNYDGLKSVATSAHAVLTEAMPYVNNVDIKNRMKDVLRRLDIWGAHP
jgi:hypothetical protein